MSAPRGDESPLRTRDFAALYGLALGAAGWLGPPGPLYWDSFGYVAQALRGQVGGLALGRPLFVYASHLVARGWLACTGGDAAGLEPALRFVWLAASALSAPLTAALARAVGLEPRAARWAGALLALSPAFAHSSAAVLTDGPAATACVLCLFAAARATGASTRARGAAWALASGLAGGAAFGLREASAAMLLVALGALASAKGSGAGAGASKRERGVAVLLALAGAALAGLGPVLYAAATQPAYGALVAGWLRAMRLERAQHPYGARDALAYAGWLCAFGPVLLVFALRGWGAASAWARGPARWVALGSLAQLAALGAYQDIAFSPRYLLATVPAGLALAAGFALGAWWSRASRAGRAAVLVALVAPVLAGGPALRWRQRAWWSALATLDARLEALPAGAVVVSGQLCPAVGLAVERVRRRGEPPRLERVCPGWGWPARLDEALDGYRAQGRTVLLDLRGALWFGERQQRALAQARAYERREAEGAGGGAAARWGALRVWRD